MLIGSTFAWFTDSVTSAGNIIKSGKLDVEMYWADGKEAPATTTAWTDASKDPVFKYDKWEPGYTEVRHIKIENVGTLALKYQLSIIPTGEVSDLTDVIDVYYLDPAAAIADRAKLDENKKIGTLTDVLAGMATTASGNLLPEGEHVVTIALKMREDAGNEYQNKSIGTSFSVQLLATQLTAEIDSFDNQYDKDSEFAVEVNTIDELALALKTGGKVKLANDITAASAMEVPAGANVVLDLNGNTLSCTAIKQRHVLVNNGTLVVEGGTIASLGDDGGSAIVNNGTLTAKDVTLKGAPFVGIDGIWFPSYAVNNKGTMTLTDSVVIAEHGGVASTGGVVTLNNVKITAGKDGKTNAAVYTNGGTVVINGGTYTNRAVDQNATGASVINGAVTVNAGTFSGRIESYYGTPVIKGGTFSVEPNANFVAPGYQTTNNGDGTYTVGAYEISTGAELADAIANGKVVELTQDVSLGKIDLTGAITNDVVIDANGHKITTTDSYGIEVTAGKNVTISNADVEMTKEGDYITYAAGFKIANGDYEGSTITLKDCKITMANTDWAYAVNMPASVKNLNLVIDNCTLEGAIAVQCWGDNNTVTITNSKLICNYTTSALYTSYCVVLQEDGYNMAENNTFVIDNCEFAYTGIDNFDSPIYAVADIGSNNNTITVTNCVYGEKVVAN
jgi:predicted ribosomally synthesized peptide with SipW-like signal peptide